MTVDRDGSTRDKLKDTFPQFAQNEFERIAAFLLEHHRSRQTAAETQSGDRGEQLENMIPALCAVCARPLTLAEERFCHKNGPIRGSTLVLLASTAGAPVSVMNASTKTQRFLEYTDCSTRQKALSNCRRAALAHSGTYIPNSGWWEKEQFWSAFAAEIAIKAAKYPVSEAEHFDHIEEIADALSTSHHARILRSQRLRIGIVQKAFNLYLKFLWCLERDWPEPPHCPVDRVILQHCGIESSWTQLDSIHTYSAWIDQIRRRAKADGYSSLAQWELRIWTP